MTRDELARLGIRVDAGVHARLTAFVEALLDANQQVNLTAIRDAERVWPLHVCDSLSILPLLPAKGAGTLRLIDVGSGGGVPGIPIACVRGDVEVTLLDSTAKKMRAAQTIADRVGLANVRTLWGRAEAVSTERAQRGRYGLATARAVADLDTLVALVSGFLSSGGLAVFFKSTNGLVEEVSSAADSAARNRLALLGTTEYELPEPHGRRALVTYQKT